MHPLKHFPLLTLSLTLTTFPLGALSAPLEPAHSTRQPPPINSLLIYNPSAPPLTFTYTTPTPNTTNWIALCPPSSSPSLTNATAPEDPALLWEHAPHSSGTIHLNPRDIVPTLPKGEYTAWFLGEDGYESLAEPVGVRFEGVQAELYFPVGEVRLGNARRGEGFVAAGVGGLVLGRDSSAGSGEEEEGGVRFEKVDGDEWVQVDEQGGISGTPDARCRDVAEVEVAAVAENGSRAVLKVEIPVVAKEAHLVEELAVMSYNLWAGGSNVRRYHEKQLRFILESGADVIGLQESAEGEHAVRLGKALGWYYWQSNYSVGIISRYPIVEEHGPVKEVEIPVANRTGSAGGGVRINLNGEAGERVELDFWSAHLHYTPYGPYDFCFDGNTTDEVLGNEAYSGREAQMQAMVERIKPQIDASTAKMPVILVGDMNAPSYLDWVESLREKNCGIADFAWPTSILPTEAGLIDSFRVAHPDPAAE